MPSKNRDLGTSQSPSAIHGFAPGGASADYIRVLDGHEPNALGLDGANMHDPTAPDMDWGGAEPIGI